MQSIPKTPANIKSITQPRYYATLHEIEGIATITPDGVLFQANGATGPEGTISIDIHEPGLVLAGRCDLADAQRDAQVMDPITGEFEVNTGRTTCVFRQCSAGFTWRQTGQPILVTGKMWGFRDRAFKQRIDAALPAKVWWADYAFDLLL